MPVYSSGSRRPGRPSRAFRLAYFDARPYAGALYRDTDAALDDVREAVTTLEKTERTARRVLGGSHPLIEVIELRLRNARATLAARETPSASK